MACLGLFVVFFAGMVVSGAAVFEEEQRAHGVTQAVSVLDYLRTGSFVEAMFEKSEFIAVAAIVGLSVFLRQRGSSESKPVADPHRVTSA